MTTELRDVLSRIDGAKRAGHGYLGRCPAHDDRHASLSVAEGKSVAVVLNCKSGCEFAAIEGALGFAPGELARRSPKNRSAELRPVAEYTYRHADGSLYARKERCIDDVGAKTFRWSRPDPSDGSRWVSGTKGEIPLYRLPELIGAPPGETVLIVEGEKDADRLASLGCVVTTTPNGASAKWRETDSAFFAGRRVCVLADDDEPGRKKASNTAEALRHVAASVGITTLPNPNRIKGFDASDFLDSGGTVEELNRIIESAFTPRLPAEVVAPDALTDRVLRLWEKGDEPGVFPGWDRLRHLYRPRLGEMTIVTGAPNAGKSTWLDDLMVRIACGDESPAGEIAARWRWLVFSAEQFPPERHASKLLQKILSKPFAEGPSPRIQRAELRAAMDLFHEHFALLDPSFAGCTLDRILEVAREMNGRRPIQGLVLDPFNVISATSRTKTESEAEFINSLLSRLRAFAQSERVHVVVVAHPTKLRREDGESEYPVPRPWDISGSAHWYNHADAVVAVWRALRDQERLGRGEVEIHLQKVRFQPECGQLGMAKLFFDRVTTRFLEHPLAPWETA